MLSSNKINKESIRMRKMSFIAVLAILGFTLPHVIGSFFDDASRTRVSETRKGRESHLADGTTPYPFCWPAACLTGKTKAADHGTAKSTQFRYTGSVRLADGTTPYPFCFPRACSFGRLLAQWRAGRLRTAHIRSIGLYCLWQ